MITADPRQHLKTATDERCCRNCDAWAEDRTWETMGDCLRVRWVVLVPIPGTLKLRKKRWDHEYREVAQVTCSDHVCAKFRQAWNSIDARAEQARTVGLG